MRLYEINAALEELLNQVDPETGELVCDMDALEALSIEREEKLEGLALYCKNLTAEAEAIRNEEKALAERRRSLENKAERAKGFLAEQLSGEKFSTPKVAVSYRTSKAVEITDEESFWAYAFKHPGFIRQKQPEADKTAIGAALKNGQEIPGAELIEKLNMSIK